MINHYENHYYIILHVTTVAFVEATGMPAVPSSSRILRDDQHVRNASGNTSLQIWGFTSWITSHNGFTKFGGDIDIDI
jgi:hypothetical protein